MIDKFSIGQKIRKFRKRSKLSQLDLEIEINASPGSISRIESGDTNPTKETIHKISEVLKLSPEELAVLFGIELSKNISEIENHEAIMANYKKNINPYAFILEMDLNNTLESILDELDKMGFIYTAIYLKQQDNELYQLKKARVSENSLSFANEILEKEIYEVEYTIADKTLVTHAILTGQIQTSEELFELLFPHLGNIYSLQSSIDTKLMIALPLKINSTVIGCITFQSKEKELSGKQIESLIEFASNSASAIYTAEIKREIDFRSESKSTHELPLLIGNLKNFLGFREFFILFRSNRHLRIYTSLFTIFASIWLFNQLFLDQESFGYKAFTHIYFVMAAYAAYMGYKTYKLVGSNNKLSKMVLILTLISTNHTLGQISFSTAHYLTNYYTPYPSFSDIFFFSATCLSLVLSFYSFNYIKRKSSMLIIDIYTKIIVALIGIILFVLMYSISNQDYTPSSEDFSATIFDLAYNIGQTLAVVFSLLGLIVLRRSTVSKETSFFLVLYFYTSILLYIADFIFTLEYTTKGIIPGGFSDLIYLCHYSMIGIGHIILLAIIQKKLCVLRRVNNDSQSKELLESVVGKIVN